MIQITNKGRMWWLYKGSQVVGFASTYESALFRVRELEKALNPSTYRKVKLIEPTIRGRKAYIAILDDTYTTEN